MSQTNKCSTCDGKGKNTRGHRCLDCMGTGNYQEPEIMEDTEQACKHCFHDNFTDPPLDDLEAACNCDCHDALEFDDEAEMCD